MPKATIQLDDNTLGYEARPQVGARAPGVLIIQPIQGLTQYPVEVAKTFASHGYVGLAVNLFEGQTAQGTEDGTPLRQRLADELFEAKMGAATRSIQFQTYCRWRIGVEGFCMGGGFSLRTACLFLDEVQACSISYGRMEDEELLQRLQCPVAGNFGGDDEGVTRWA